MNDHYKIRKDLALKITDELKDDSDAIILVGSVAYGENAVNPSSDLDMVLIAENFGTVNFQNIYKALNASLDVDKDIVTEASNRNGNIFSIHGKRDGIDIGLNIWEKPALDNILNLSGPNTILKPKDYVGGSQNQFLTSLTSDKHELEVRDLGFAKGIINFPYYENHDKKHPELYFGVHFVNAIASPQVLYDKNQHSDNSLKHKLENDFRMKTKGKIRNHLKKVNRKDKSKHSIFNIFPRKVLNRIDHAPKLRSSLQELMRY